MAYIRKVIAPEEIRRQEAICASIAARLRAEGARPLAMVDTYGCQQNEADSEKLRGYRVDFIHRVEFGEVSGHRVLIKRGPGNRGPTECGTTHEATSGMSS